MLPTVRRDGALWCAVGAAVDALGALVNEHHLSDARLAAVFGPTLSRERVAAALRPADADDGGIVARLDVHIGAGDGRTVRAARRARQRRRRRRDAG